MSKERIDMILVDWDDELPHVWAYTENGENIRFVSAYEVHKGSEKPVKTQEVMREILSDTCLDVDEVDFRIHLTASSFQEQRTDLQECI